MPGFSDILGNEMIKEYFQRTLSNGQISHAYILTGEAGMGRKTLAKTFAMTLLCEENHEIHGNYDPDQISLFDDMSFMDSSNSLSNEIAQNEMEAGSYTGKVKDPCGQCHSCIQFQTDNHPDVIYVTHAKEGIGVDDIREQINGTVQIKPYSSPYKIYIVDEAEKMTIQAQNALLKTLEEPPAYVVILLLTTRADFFLPTILSRCITLKLKPLYDEVIREYLMDRLHVQKEDADVYTAFARGNLGKAIALSSSDSFADMRYSVMSLLRNARNIDTILMLETVKRWKEDRLNIQECLEFMQLWYRDVLMFKATQDMAGLIFREEYKHIRETSTKSSFYGIEKILEAIDKAKQRLEANVNYELAMELLLLTIKENSL